MAKVINYKAKRVTYMEISEDNDLKISFAIVDGRLFLPMSLHHNKDGRILAKINPTNVEVYRREREGGFVPCEWLAQQYPFMAGRIESFKEVVRDMVPYGLRNF